MQQHSDNVRTAFKYKLKPTPAQTQVLETVLHHCRTLYNAALEQRKTWWERGQGKSASYYQQKAEIPDLKAACLKYTEINAQVLQDVLLRLDRTFQAPCRCWRDARLSALSGPWALYEVHPSAGRRAWRRTP
jgi:transposase